MLPKGLWWSPQFRHPLWRRPRHGRFGDAASTRMCSTVTRSRQGFEYWFHQINAGVQTVPMVLAKFSESPENQANLMGVIGDGFSYIPFG